MKPVFDMARAHKKRVVYPEGESRRVLQACQVLVDDGVCHPVVIGRREVILDRIAELEPERIILIKADVLRVAYPALAAAGLPVSQMLIPCPSIGRQRDLWVTF